MKPTKLPSGAWRCRVYLGKSPEGKPIYKSITRNDYYECLTEAAQLAKHHHETERDQSTLTLGEAIDKYISIKDSVLSPATIRNYESIHKHHLQPELDLPLHKISSNVAQAAINRESKDFSPKTVLNIYRLLTAVLNQFTDQKISVTLPQQVVKEHNTLTEEQLKTLVTALQGDKSEIPLLLALFLGLRRSEILALEHDDYDPETKQISVNKALVPNKDQKFVIKTTKTKCSQRKISVPPYLAERLEARINSGEKFCSVAPERPYKRLQQLCERYGLPSITMHDLRHQNASIMLKLGVPDKYAMERGGWSSNQTMKNIYQHTMTNERETIDNKMNAYFESLTK